VLIAVERNGPVRSAPVPNDSILNLWPVIDRFVDKRSHLKTDELQAYQVIGRRYASHQWVKHLAREYARGDIHNNTAESFNAMLERAKNGVFHFLSKKHLSRYLHEIGFRWNHREPELKFTKKGRLKIVMKRLPALTMLKSLLSNASGRQIRRSVNGGILCLEHD
jgi:transposase-like protein